MNWLWVVRLACTFATPSKPSFSLRDPPCRDESLDTQQAGSGAPGQHAHMNGFGHGHGDESGAAEAAGKDVAGLQSDAAEEAGFDGPAASDIDGPGAVDDETSGAADGYAPAAAEGAESESADDAAAAGGGGEMGTDAEASHTGAGWSDLGIAGQEPGGAAAGAPSSEAAAPADAQPTPAPLHPIMRGSITHTPTQTHPRVFSWVGEWAMSEADTITSEFRCVVTVSPDGTCIFRYSNVSLCVLGAATRLTYPSHTSRRWRRRGTSRATRCCRPHTTTAPCPALLTGTSCSRRADL